MNCCMLGVIAVLLSMGIAQADSGAIKQDFYVKIKNLDRMPQKKVQVKEVKSFSLKNSDDGWFARSWSALKSLFQTSGHSKDAEKKLMSKRQPKTLPQWTQELLDQQYLRSVTEKMIQENTTSRQIEKKIKIVKQAEIKINEPLRATEKSLEAIKKEIAIYDSFNSDPYKIVYKKALNDALSKQIERRNNLIKKRKESARKLFEEIFKTIQKNSK